ncbi:hypothetical protein QBC46DRAFT_439870 [Diplogelasinospora grovesii]|uniref:Uncharacterized protein n=1 Tax=Diplogelasinospora grovesii TaxID=303347 RepID=A0AAN6N5K2_9PEZI|nr:hypothetical protein QBC46DRAFT_439870 [Diplogelasinospora grovesii]
MCPSTDDLGGHQWLLLLLLLLTALQARNDQPLEHKPGPAVPSALFLLPHGAGVCSQLPPQLRSHETAIAGQPQGRHRRSDPREAEGHARLQNVDSQDRRASGAYEALLNEAQLNESRGCPANTGTHTKRSVCQQRNGR